jgi:hypothetical protein
VAAGGDVIDMTDMTGMTGMNLSTPPLPPPISTFSKLIALFLFLAGTFGTVGALFRNQIDDNLDWIALIFLALTLAAFIRAMIQPRAVTLLISMGLSLGMIIFSSMVFLHL